MLLSSRPDCTSKKTGTTSWSGEVLAWAGFQKPYSASNRNLLLGTSTEGAKVMTVELLIGVMIGFVIADMYGQCGTDFTLRVVF